MKQCCVILYNVQYVPTLEFYICCVLHLKSPLSDIGIILSLFFFKCFLKFHFLSKAFPNHLFKIRMSTNKHTQIHNAHPVSSSSIYHYLTQYILHIGFVIIYLPSIDCKFHESGIFFVPFLHYLAFNTMSVTQKVVNKICCMNE